MEEKIKQINSLNESINQLESFLWLLENSDVDSKYGEKNKPKRNEFSSFSVKSSLWTGSDNPYCEKKITDNDTMNELSKVMKIVLLAKIENKKYKLQSLIN